MPRQSRIEAELAARGYGYNRQTRQAITPGGETISRRQAESIIGRPLPTVRLDAQDRRNMATFIRTRAREGEQLTARQAATDPRFLEARRTLRADRQQQRIDREGAQEVRDALAEIFGEDRVGDWDNYIETAA